MTYTADEVDSVLHGMKSNDRRLRDSMLRAYAASLREREYEDQEIRCLAFRTGALWGIANPTTNEPVELHVSCPSNEYAENPWKWDRDANLAQAATSLREREAKGVTDEMVETAWMHLTGRAGKIGYEKDYQCMMDIERKAVRAALESVCPSVPEEISRAILSKDLYAVLMDVQNHIDSPGLPSMANRAIIQIDKARDALSAPTSKPVEGYNHDSPPDTDPTSQHRNAWYAGMADGPEPDGD